MVRFFIQKKICVTFFKKEWFVVSTVLCNVYCIRIMKYLLYSWRKILNIPQWLRKYFQQIHARRYLLINHHFLCIHKVLFTVKCKLMKLNCSISYFQIPSSCFGYAYNDCSNAISIGTGSRRYGQTLIHGYPPQSFMMHSFLCSPFPFGGRHRSSTKMFKFK